MWKSLISTICILTSVYTSYYVYHAASLLYNPIRAYENILDQKTDIYPGDSITIIRQYVEEGGCYAKANRRLIPATPDNIKAPRAVFDKPDPLVVSGPLTVRTTVGGPIIHNLKYEIPKEIAPGNYIWVVKTQYYCNIFNYVWGPYTYYPVPVYINILDPKLVPKKPV